jgi:hypothetical protein
VSFVATGGKNSRHERGEMAPVPVDPTLAPRETWRPALVGLARRPGFVAVMLAVGFLVAYAALQLGLSASARGAGAKHAPPPSPADAQRCWTNDSSATVFLAPWFAPLAPTKGLRSDCSMQADPSAAGLVAGASPALGAPSPPTRTTPSTASGSTVPGRAGRAGAAADGHAGSPKASGRATAGPAKAQPWTPPPAAPNPHRSDGHGGWPSGPPVRDGRGQHHDEVGTGGGPGNQW